MISDRINNIIQNIISKEYTTMLAKDYIESNTNINILGDGVDRIVIEDPSTGHAVKISCDSDYNQNKTESQIYSQVSKKARNKLLPILYVEPNYQYIVTPKVSKTLDPILGEPFTGPNAKKILDILNNEGFNLSEIETAHYNDKIVAIDYGKLKNT